MTHFGRLLGATALAFTGATAGAQTLTGALATPPTSMDPLFQQLGANQELAIHVFDTLLRMDETMNVQPGLAESWAPTEDPTVWEFRLREGVTFHNGAPLTAEDVVFSFNRALDVPGAPSTYSRALANVDVPGTEAVDDLTVHVRTKEPFPVLPRMMTAVPIVSATIGEGADPSSFNDGTLTYGTGPYLFEEYVPGDRVSYVANPDYWGEPPQWERVVYRFIESGPTRVASLLAGDVDVIAEVPTTDVETLEADPAVNVACGPTTRLIHWTMDVGREVAQHITAKDGSEIPNPLRDLRVRQAIDMAIDRDVIVTQVMNGLAIPTKQFVPAGFSGYTANVTLPEADMDRARALMEEAGYGDGFRMTIHATNDRYVNDSEQAQAVAQMLSRIGIEVDVVTQPVANFFNRARNREFTFMMVGFAATSGEPSSIMSPVLVSGSVNNYGDWEHEEFNELYAEALRTVDPEAHEALMKEAIEVAMADVPIIPSHHQVGCWATRAGLTPAAYPDTYTRADAIVPE
jgi:peptide/nickel transport system substrate-binding protein